MKILVDWDNPDKTIVRYTFEHGWEWPDLHQAMTNAGEMLASVDHTVHVIMDLRNANIVPKNALLQIKRGYDNPKPPNIGVTVIVTPNAFMSAMVSLAKKIRGDAADWELDFVKTMDEAYHKIDQRSTNETKTNG